MKCVIFGGAGFIGSMLVERLLKEGYELRIFEKPGILPHRKFEVHEPVQWITGDLSSIQAVNNAVAGCHIVLHLVSTTLPKSSNDDPIYDVQSNLVGTLQMLNAMVSQGVKKIVFISSGGTVYGVPKYIPIDENHPTDPLVSYGVTKLAIEKYLNIFERIHGIRSIILRVANPYGERQRVLAAQGAVGVFLHRAIRNAPVEIWGDGNTTRDYVHVSDVAEAFVRAINYSGQKSIFNIGSGSGISLNELILIIEEVLGRPVSRIYLPSRPFDVEVSVLGNELAKQELQWRPVISIRDGIRRTADWMSGELMK